MKKINIFLLLLAVAAFFSSCLKDPNITDDLLYGDEGIGKSTIIDIPAGTEVDNYIDNTEGERVVDLLEFRYGNEDPAPEDIVIELEYDQDLLDEYTDYYGTGHVIPASTKYSLVNGMKVVIPKGQRNAFFQIKVSPADFLGGEYAFPITIKSITPNHTLNALRDHSIVAFGTKNRYDGAYSLNIMTSGWGVYGISDGLAANFPRGIHLVTTGGNSVGTYSPYIQNKDGLQVAFTTGNASATQFGGAAPMFTFDLTTNKITSVVNRLDDGARGRNFILNPSAPTSHNVYDLDTGEVTANFLLRQPGRPDMVIIMKMKYNGPR